MSKIIWIKNPHQKNVHLGTIEGSSQRFVVDREHEQWRLIAPPNKMRPNGRLFYSVELSEVKKEADHWFECYEAYFFKEETKNTSQ